MPSTVYIAAAGFERQLVEELERQGGAVEVVLPGIVRHAGAVRRSAWAANIWYEAEELSVPSIGRAAAALRQRGPWWGLQPGRALRRSHLIAAKLLRWRDEAQAFPLARPPRPLGAYTLLAEDRLLCAARTARPFAAGAPHFVEDHAGPPSRAYRKLYEALTLLGRRPAAGEQCVDFGAAPGAWTWTLARLGARCHAVDKAPIAAAVAALPEVSAEQGSAFAVDPGARPVDWLFSDVICYPERLLRLCRRWLADSACRHYCLTIKLQGADDVAVLDPFWELPQAHIFHGHHNKHELTLLIHPGLHEAWRRPWPWLATEATEVDSG